MVCTNFEEWKRWIVSFNMLPYIREIDWQGGLPPTWERFWDRADSWSFVLESGRTGNYTYLSIVPRAVLTGNEHEATEHLRKNPPDFSLLAGERADSMNGKAGNEKSGSGKSGNEKSGNEKSGNKKSGNGKSGTSGIHSVDQSDTLYEKVNHWKGSPIHILRRWMSQYRGPDDLDVPYFTGGSVGYLGYDVARTLEKLPVIAERDQKLPDYCLMMVDHVWVYDHNRQKLILCHYTCISREMANEDEGLTKLQRLYDKAEKTVEEMLSLWSMSVDEGQEDGWRRKDAYLQFEARDHLAIDLEHATDLKTSMSKEQFTAAVERIQDYIRAGDVFQVNLSVRQERELSVSPEIVYEWLRWLNPSPYMGILRLGKYALVSASPELLIKKEGRKLRTRPIGGTRRRGRTEEEDMILEQELRNNEKERAEHVMLIDLERNDIGRVASCGTVKVDQLMVIERYSHVMHLVSDISGELAPQYDTFDALAALFPGGTITGAPKIRTMEIIEELEPVRRGVYTGSFGWIDYRGDMEFNIIIRTLVAGEGRAWVQAGAGIVIDSIPVREYRESLNKAKALWKAVEYAERSEAHLNEAEQLSERSEGHLNEAEYLSERSEAHPNDGAHPDALRHKDVSREPRPKSQPSEGGGAS